MAANLNKLNPSESTGTVYIFNDEFTNYNDVNVGVSAVRLLTSLGYRVLTVRHPVSSRTYISKGFLRRAKKNIIENIDIFSPLITKDTPLIGFEPSAILGFRDEFPELAGEKYRQKALSIASNAFQLEEFLINEFRSGRIKSSSFTDEKAEVLVHVHCQGKAIAGSSPFVEALGIPANYSVREIPSGCCGMAGAFGYEKEHYDLSQKIGEMVLFPEVRAASEHVIVAAPGTSCRHHIKDGTGRKALHPAEILWNAVRKG